MKRRTIKRIGLLAIAAMLTMASAFTSLAAKERLSRPDNLYWSSTSKDDDEDYDEGSYAKWDPVEHASKYEITLYREDENGSVKTVTTVTSKSAKYNFRSKMTEEGEYYFRVRAESSKSDYTTSLWSSYSDTYYVSASAAENAANGLYSSDDTTAVALIRSDQGWVTDAFGVRYQLSDGNFAPGGWFQDPSNGCWFYLDQNGYVMTGFIDLEDGIYYCDPFATPYGAMATGPILYDGVIYNFDQSGLLISTEDGLGLEEGDD